MTYDHDNSGELASRTRLGDFEPELEALATALRVLNEKLPPKTTTRQLQILLEVALATSKQEDACLGKIAQKLGRLEIANIHKSAQMYVRRGTDGLDWIRQKSSTEDARERRVFIAYPGAGPLREAAATLGSLRGRAPHPKPKRYRKFRLT